MTQDDLRDRASRAPTLTQSDSNQDNTPGASMLVEYGYHINPKQPFTVLRCSQQEMRVKTKEKHGGSRMPEYLVWQTMIARTTNPNAKDFGRYGGRGIKVCERWRDSFQAFIEDLGRRPSPKHQLDRIDNDGHYEPGNVRWATHREQQRNKRDNRTLTHEGVTLCIAEWAERFGLSPDTIKTRLRRGATSAEALHKGDLRDLRPLRRSDKSNDATDRCSSAAGGGVR